MSRRKKYKAPMYYIDPQPAKNRVVVRECSTDNSVAVFRDDRKGMSPLIATTMALLHCFILELRGKNP